MSILGKGRILEKKLLKYKQEFPRFVEGEREMAEQQHSNLNVEINKMRHGKDFASPRNYELFNATEALGGKKGVG